MGASTLVDTGLPSSASRSCMHCGYNAYIIRPVTHTHTHTHTHTSHYTHHTQHITHSTSHTAHHTQHITHITSQAHHTQHITHSTSHTAHHTATHHTATHHTATHHTATHHTATHHISLSPWSFHHLASTQIYSCTGRDDHYTPPHDTAPTTLTYQQTRSTDTCSPD